MPETSSLLYLYGTDEYAIARRLDGIQARLDKDGLNTVRLDARSASKNDLNEAVNAMPFLGAKRLVFIAHPSGCSSDPAEREKFIRFLLAAPETTQVVIHEVLDNREIKTHWAVKRAEKGEFKGEALLLPRGYEMSAWIVKEAKRQEGVIEPAGAAVLAEMIGEDTRTAAQEITKLLQYASGRPVTLADVNAVSIVSRQGDIFGLVDAMAAGRGKEAQVMLKRLLDEEDVFALWGMVIRQFRLLLLAREVLDGGGSAASVQKALGVHEFVARKVSEQAGRFRLPALERIYHRLLEMDAAAKTSQVPLDLALDMLIVELAPGA